MKRLFILLFISIIFIACQKQQKLETTIIKANTMVCEKCAENLKKAIYNVEGVKEVNVDLDTKTVEVKFIPVQTNVETIELSITGAGYDANNRKRNPDAYEKLAPCCKIDG